MRSSYIKKIKIEKTIFDVDGPAKSFRKPTRPSLHWGEMVWPCHDEKNRKPSNGCSLGKSLSRKILL